MKVGIAGFCAAVLTAASLLLCAGNAFGHSDENPTGASGAFAPAPSAVEAHQTEHETLMDAELDARREWKRMSSAERQASRRRAEQAELDRQAERSPGSARQVGRWTEAPFDLPAYAIHAALLPTGKILFWGYPPLGQGGRPNEGEAALWDPAQGTGAQSFEEVDPPLIDAEGDGDLEHAPLYCSGQSFLPNGALLVTGGNFIWPHASGGVYDGYSGLDTIFTFNPWAEAGEYWIQQPSMEAGRWYPTQVLLGDGRTAIFGGYNEDAPGNEMSDHLEIFDPSKDPAGIGAVKRFPQADQDGTLYPHMFTLPDGDVLTTGPYPEDNFRLDTSRAIPEWSASEEFDEPRIGGTGIINPQGSKGSFEVMLMGGYGYSTQGKADATRTTEYLDASDSSGEWKRGASMNEVRSNHNTIQLPDRSLLAVGGGIGRNNDEGNFRIDPRGPQRNVEVFDPERDRWRLGPAQAEDRAYHSTAVLLPDGRVWSAGDDAHPTEANGEPSDVDTAEIYSPPYLFKGERPSIESAPDQVDWKDRFKISAPGARKAVLIAPAATTHAVDMNQRLVPLKRVRKQSGGRLTLKAPPSTEVAPPGYYMLFVLNRKGVPSVASWVGLGPDATSPAAR